MGNVIFEFLFDVFREMFRYGKRAAAGKSRLLLCGLAGTFEARERCLALQDFPLLRIDPSGGLGEGRLVGSRSGVARCGGPWSGSSSSDRGFYLPRSPRAPRRSLPFALVHMRLRTDIV